MGANLTEEWRCSFAEDKTGMVIRPYLPLPCSMIWDSRTRTIAELNRCDGARRGHWHRYRSQLRLSKLCDTMAWSDGLPLRPLGHRAFGVPSF